MVWVWVQVREAYPDLKIQIGCVAYRDHCDGPDRIQLLSFQPSISALESFLGTVEAKGGGDGPEDVHGMLQIAGRCVPSVRPVLTRLAPSVRLVPCLIPRCIWYLISGWQRELGCSGLQHHPRPRPPRGCPLPREPLPQGGGRRLPGRRPSRPRLAHVRAS